jgi:PRTRC genetic system protein C
MTQQAHGQAVIVRPVRVFLDGPVRFPDPDPLLPPEDALRLYAASYPHLATATLAEPELKGEELHYRVNKEAVKTKG